MDRVAGSPSKSTVPVPAKNAPSPAVFAQLPATVKVAEGDRGTLAVSEFLSGGGEGAGAVVGPDGIGPVGEVCNKYIEIAVAIEIAEGDRLADAVSECLARVGEGVGAVVDPNGVRAHVPDPCVEIAVAVKIAEGDREASAVAIFSC